MPPAAFAPHDHHTCRRRARDEVAAACSARGLRLTPARAFVLETLLESHRAMTAYELLDRLREAGLGHQPPVVYRALDFLLRQGFAHRIERLGAYLACTHGEECDRAAFIVCRGCRSVAETTLPRSGRGLITQAERAGFKVERVVVEAEGLCPACQGVAA